MFKGLAHRDGTRSEPHENSLFTLGKKTSLPYREGDMSSHAEFRCISRSDRESTPATPSWFGENVISLVSIWAISRLLYWLLQFTFVGSYWCLL
jgi:hypothetical protein